MSLWAKVKLWFIRRKLVEHTFSDATARVPVLGTMRYYYDSVSDTLYVPAHQYALDNFLDKTEDLLQ
jgi:hypothetical protein